MGICTRRHFLLTICGLQLVSTIERQIFDFLGYMWAPILANFLHIIFVIFGFFGTFQYRPKYIITYTVWSVLWIGWNVFVMCFYLDVGVLDKNSDVLNLGTGSISWWESNGAGCKPVYSSNLTSEDPDPFRPLRPDIVIGCVLEYQYVEVLHAALQCILAVFGGLGGVSVSHVFLEEDDSFDFLGGLDHKSPQHLALRPMYVSPDYEPVPIYSSSRRSSSQLTRISSRNLARFGSDKIRVSHPTIYNTHPFPLQKSVPKGRPKSMHVPHDNSEYL